MSSVPGCHVTSVALADVGHMIFMKKFEPMSSFGILQMSFRLCAD